MKQVTRDEFYKVVDTYRKAGWSIQALSNGLWRAETASSARIFGQRWEREGVVSYYLDTSAQVTGDESQEVYCEYCKLPPPYDYGCRCSGNGSHQPRLRGEKAWRAVGPDGYTYRFSHQPSEKYRVIEVITY